MEKNYVVVSMIPVRVYVFCEYAGTYCVRIHRRIYTDGVFVQGARNVEGSRVTRGDGLRATGTRERGGGKDDGGPAGTVKTKYEDRPACDRKAYDRREEERRLYRPNTVLHRSA